VLWWYFRPDGEHHRAAQAQLDADTAAAVTDPDEILVDLADDASPGPIEQALGIHLVLVDDSGTAARTKLFRAQVDPARRDEILAQLSRRADVEIAEPDAQMQLSPAEQEVEVAEESPGPAHEFPNDPLYKHQWHMDQIGMPEAWQLADGNGVIVAVLDTGV